MDSVRNCLSQCDEKVQNFMPTPVLPNYSLLEERRLKVRKSAIRQRRLIILSQIVKVATPYMSNSEKEELSAASLRRLITPSLGQLCVWGVVLFIF